MSSSEYILAPNQTHKRTASWSEITNVKLNEKCTQTYADRPNHLAVPDPNKTQVSNMVSLSSHPSPSQLDFPDEKTSAKREQSPMDSSLSFSAETEDMRMERLLGSLCHNDIPITQAGSSRGITDTPRVPHPSWILPDSNSRPIWQTSET